MGTRTKLSALWLLATLNYVYCDVVGLMDPNLLRKFLAGSIGTIQVSQGFLFASSALVENPIAMVAHRLHAAGAPVVGDHVQDHLPSGVSPMGFLRGGPALRRCPRTSRGNPRANPSIAQLSAILRLVCDQP